MARFLVRMFLGPIIRRDYRLRAQGKRPDRWHWADKIAVRFGNFEC